MQIALEELVLCKRRLESLRCSRKLWAAEYYPQHGRNGHAGDKTAGLGMKVGESEYPDDDEYPARRAREAADMLMRDIDETSSSSRADEALALPDRPGQQRHGLIAAMKMQAGRTDEAGGQGLSGGGVLVDSDGALKVCDDQSWQERRRACSHQVNCLERTPNAARQLALLTAAHFRVFMVRCA